MEGNAQIIPSLAPLPQRLKPCMLLVRITTYASNIDEVRVQMILEYGS